MGWAHGTLPDGRQVGYAVESTCEQPGCEAAIDRGLSYLCGEMHGQDDDACGHYFCGEHLYHTDAGQRCQPCADAPPDCTCETVADERVCTRPCPDRQPKEAPDGDHT